MFCCTLLYVHSRFAIILMGKKELLALLGLSSWCLVIVVWLFLVVPLVCLRFVILVFPDHTIFVAVVFLLFFFCFVVLVVLNTYCISFAQTQSMFFVCFNVLRHSQQFFVNVRMDLPGLNQHILHMIRVKLRS